jgi:F-box protein 18 (helicase)
VLTRRHDLILLDEAQDTNPVTADIVFSQRCGKVLVGDRHQSIYGFRGSINAMDRLPEGEVHYLTHSMRFGEPVARVASVLLHALKGERQAIKGSGVMAASPFRIDRSRPHAIICRTNASVFSRAVQAVERSRIHFIGGVHTYLLGKLTDVHHLWSGRADLVKDGFYRAFEDFDSLALYGRETADKDILSVVSVVKEYGAALPRLIDQVSACACAQPGEANLLLMTAHRAKGLEFDQVLLDDDFHDLVDKKGRPNHGAMDSHAFEQEVNLLYVALTRARHAVELNPQLQAVLDAVQAGKLRPP